MPHTSSSPRTPDVARALAAILLALVVTGAAPRTVAAQPAPSLVFSTYLGGTGSGDNGEFWEQSTIASVVVDAAGNVLVSGDTNTTDIGADAVHDHRAGGGGVTQRDVYVAKLDPTGSRVLWIAFLGGALNDDRASAAFAPDGTIFVVGRTASAIAITTAAYQAVLRGGYDTFVARLSADGATLINQTYLGGGGDDSPGDIAVDSSGRLHIVGTTSFLGAPDFPTSAGVLQPARADESTDAFVARLSFGSDGSSRLDWSTFLGGAKCPPPPDGPPAPGTPSCDAVDRGIGIGLTPAGAVVVGGFTGSTDFPVRNAIRPSLAGAGDLFVARLTAGGEALEFSTYLGGAADEGGSGIPVPPQAHLAVVDEEDVVIAGMTNSGDFPTVNASQAALAGALDAFATRLRWDGATLSYVFSTFVGKTGADIAFDVAVDRLGSTVLVGSRQNAAGTAQDAFLTKLSPTGVLQWDITHGGTVGFGHLPSALTGSDVALGVGLDPLGDIYLTGQTLSSDFPVRSRGVDGAAYDSALGGARDAFVARFTEGFAPVLTTVTPATAPVAGGTSVRLTGANFLVGSDVTVGGVKATNVTVVDERTITFVTPGGPLGAAPIVVTSPTGQAVLLAPGFAYDADTDGDGLSDTWEQLFGLSTTSGAGEDGATGDRDRDGASNLKEQADGTNPTMAEVRYFAEGATIDPFTMRIALLNPDPTRVATAELDFLLGGSREGQVVTTTIAVNPHARGTVVPATDYPTELADAEFSTVIRSNLPLTADRLMTWDSDVFGVGSHAETAVLSPTEEWYLAEGATFGNFELYYLIQNPNAVAVDVQVTYLLPTGPLAPRTYTVGPLRRFNIYVDAQPGLADAEVSAILRSPAGSPIIVERAMYLRTPDGLFGAGHESAGITQRSKTWFFAEGATGGFFDLFLLVANPGSEPAIVTATFLTPSGQTCSKTFTTPDGRSLIGPGMRYNIWVDVERIPGCPIDFTDTALSTTLTSNVEIVAERAMWWSGDPDASRWYEAHNSAGAIASSTRWTLAEGEVGNEHLAETYILVANTSSFPGAARVTLYFEDGTQTWRDYALPANSRTNVPVGARTDVGGFGLTALDRRFGATVESLVAPGQLQPAQLVVERALYATPPGTSFWSQGANAPGTPGAPPRNGTTSR